MTARPPVCWTYGRSPVFLAGNRAMTDVGSARLQVLSQLIMGAKANREPERPAP